MSPCKNKNEKCPLWCSSSGENAFPFLICHDFLRPGARPHSAGAIWIISASAPHTSWARHCMCHAERSRRSFCKFHSPRSHSAVRHSRVFRSIYPHTASPWNNKATLLESVRAWSWLWRITHPEQVSGGCNWFFFMPCGIERKQMAAWKATDRKSNHCSIVCRMVLVITKMILKSPNPLFCPLSSHGFSHMLFQCVSPTLLSASAPVLMTVSRCRLLARLDCHCSFSLKISHIYETKSKKVSARKHARRSLVLWLQDESEFNEGAELGGIHQSQVKTAVTSTKQRFSWGRFVTAGCQSCFSIYNAKSSLIIRWDDRRRWGRVTEFNVLLCPHLLGWLSLWMCARVIFPQGALTHNIILRSACRRLRGSLHTSFIQED